jgi:hypothetical protein
LEDLCHLIEAVDTEVVARVAGPEAGDLVEAQAAVDALRARAQPRSFRNVRKDR